MSDQKDILVNECWDKKFYSFGTSKIFQRRARKLRFKLNILLFLGIVLPLFVGAYVTTYGTENQTLKAYILPAVGALSISQIVMSLWALIARWEDKYVAYMHSIATNNSIAGQCDTLAKDDFEIIKRDIQRLRSDYERQDEEDSRHLISEKEKRYAQRSSLFQFKKKCPSCGIEPHSMKPTKCDSCGRFPRRYTW